MLCKIHVTLDDEKMPTQIIRTWPHDGVSTDQETLFWDGEKWMRRYCNLCDGSSVPIKDSIRECEASELNMETVFKHYSVTLEKIRPFSVDVCLSRISPQELLNILYRIERDV